MNFALLIGLPIALFLRPSAILVFGLPFLMMLSREAALAPVIRYGTIDLLVSDVLLIAVALKVVFDPRPRPIGSRALLAMSGPIFAYLGVMLLSTFGTLFLMGQGQFVFELVSLLRLSTQIAIYFLLVLSIRDARDFRTAERWWFALGIVTAGSIYLSIALRPFGIGFGEVTTEAAGLIRYHGPLGDAVKLFLLPFAYGALLNGSLWLTGFYVLALLAGGARLALIGLVLGAGVMLWLRNPSGVVSRFAGRRVFFGVAFLLVTMFVGLYFDIGGIRTRILVPQFLKSGLGHRLATWLASIRLLTDDPTILFTGRGYGSYPLLIDPAREVEVLGQTFVPFVYSPFSQVLATLLDAGAPGLLVFLWMVRRMLGTLRSAATSETPRFRSLAQAGYVTIFTLAILSPFTVWIQPASRIGHLVWVMLAFGTALREEQERNATSAAAPPQTAGRRFA